MNFCILKSKREVIEWLYWFYDGQYSKYEIRKKDVRGWYMNLRKSGARKQIKLAKIVC